jgi:5-(carboxyamino)imidazole ribonucleotide synthase
MILPGKTIGFLGGGQLGRMSGIAARKLGYGVAVFEPVPGSPAGHVADLEVNAAYSDEAAIRSFAERCDVITYEFENVPAAAAELCASLRPTHPSPFVLSTCQNREREKTFLREKGFPHAAFEVVTSAEELAGAVAKLGTPCVMKTADFGYDGKGQRRIRSADEDWERVWSEFGAHRAVVEQWVSFERELSVICASNGQGDFLTYPVAENIHANGILDLSIVPARISEQTADAARALARSIAESLNLVGLLAVEMFLASDGQLVVNELAPRPHNSGHWSFDAAVTSQFEQHVRSVCGLPLGATDCLRPAVMVNLLGDLWRAGPPRWEIVLAEPRAKLHLYGKDRAAPGRKMGHFTALGASVDEALATAQRLQAALAGR